MLLAAEALPQLADRWGFDDVNNTEAVIQRMGGERFVQEVMDSIRRQESILKDGNVLQLLTTHEPTVAIWVTKTKVGYLLRCGVLGETTVDFATTKEPLKLQNSMQLKCMPQLAARINWTPPADGGRMEYLIEKLGPLAVATLLECLQTSQTALERRNAVKIDLKCPQPIGDVEITVKADEDGQCGCLLGEIGEFDDEAKQMRRREAELN